MTPKVCILCWVIELNDCVHELVLQFNYENAWATAQEI